MTSSLRFGRPLWLAGRTRGARYPTCSGVHETDVAIVGGGMTGALVAQAFASAGVATTLLEAALIGHGSTAASSALLLKEPDHELARLVARYGIRAGRRIWSLSSQSVDDLARLVQRLNIRCGLRRRDVVHVADRDTVDRLQREHALRRRLGFPADWLTPAAVRRLTGMVSPGAIRTRGAAQFDPYAACAGLARAAAGAGAQLFEHSPVRRITRDRATVRLHTGAGTVIARQVIVATGYATPKFRPLAGRFDLSRTYVVATAPIGARARRELGLADVMVWDTDEPYHYIRWTPDHRLVMGGEDRPIRAGAGRQRQMEAAIRRLREHFDERLPALSAIPTAFRWEGRFAVTEDSLPLIGPHRRYPRQWFALGYGGNGLTFAHLAARLLLERWQGRVSADHALFAFDRAR